MTQLSFPEFNNAGVNGNQLGATSIGLSQGLQAPVVNAPAASNLPGATVDAVDTGLGNGGENGGNFWSKDGGAGMILSGVQTLGNLWNSYQSNKIAKEQLGFAREQFSTNLANQTQTYNTALEDRIRARHNTEGRSGAETDAYIEKNSL